MDQFAIIFLAVTGIIIVGELYAGISVRRDKKRMIKEIEQINNNNENENKMNSIKIKIDEIEELKSITSKYKVNEKSNLLIKKQDAIIEYLYIYYTQYCIANFRSYVANALTMFYEEYKSRSNSVSYIIEDLFKKVDKYYEELKKKRSVDTKIFEEKCKEIIDNIKEYTLEIATVETNNIIKNISPIDDSTELSNKLDNILLYKNILYESNKKLDDEFDRFYAEISLTK
jgi:hypothetical protein